MRRVAIFAHYDKDNIIEDYVIFYLQELKKVAEKIIFVSDSNITESELEKINNIANHAITEKHGEYDFGSYKRGYLLAKELGYLQDCEELIICNDSCYGPLYPFENMFNTMSPKKLDVWGLTINPEGMSLDNGTIKSQEFPHIQSYFVVFKPQVFKSEFFDNFITSVKKEENKELIIIKYEMGLTQLLIDNNFEYDAYCQLSKIIKSSHLKGYETLILDDKCPLIKTSIFRENFKPKFPPNYKLIETQTNYDIALIKKDVIRNKKSITFTQFVQCIFSINNTYSHKIITICGFVIKIARKKKGTS